MLTKLMGISATVRLDSQESTVKLVSSPFKFECTFVLRAMHAIMSC